AWLPRAGKSAEPRSASRERPRRQRDLEPLDLRDQRLRRDPFPFQSFRERREVALVRALGAASFQAGEPFRRGSHRIRLGRQHICSETLFLFNKGSATVLFVTRADKRFFTFRRESGPARRIRASGWWPGAGPALRAVRVARAAPPRRGISLPPARCSLPCTAYRSTRAELLPLLGPRSRHGPERPWPAVHRGPVARTDRAGPQCAASIRPYSRPRRHR